MAERIERLCKVPSARRLPDVSPERLDTILRALPPTAEWAVRHRFGVGVERKTQKELAKELGFSSTRGISVVQQKGLLEAHRLAALDYGARMALRMLMPFAWPETTRGPASKKWITTMRLAQKLTGYVTCSGCDGVGEGPGVGDRGLCLRCYGTGLVRPEEIE